MDTLIHFRQMLMSGIFFLSVITVLGSTEVVLPESNFENSQAKLDLDGTQMAALVKQDVADYYHISINDVTSCYYYGQTLEGYYHYRYTISGPISGSFYVYGIIGDDYENFLYED